MGAASFEPTAPACEDLTDYDRSHIDTYLRLLDAEADGVAWEAMASRVLGQDIGVDAAGAHQMLDSHLARARWLRDGGFFRLLSE